MKTKTKLTKANMHMNNTGLNSNWDGCKPVNIKTEKDLVDANKMTATTTEPNVSMDDLDFETKKALNDELMNSPQPIEGEIITVVHKIKLKMDLSSLPDKGRKWAVKHLASNKVLDYYWVDGDIHEFIIEELKTPSAEAHMKAFGLVW